MRLKIKCHTEQSATLEELGIESDASTECRPVFVPKDKVDYFYPTSDEGTFIHVGGDDITVAESFNEVMEQYAAE